MIRMNGYCERVGSGSVWRRLGPTMHTFFSPILKLFKKQSINNDNYVFKLHYRTTVLLFVLFRYNLFWAK